jgi:TIGR03009 family protein
MRTSSLAIASLLLLTTAGLAQQQPSLNPQGQQAAGLQAKPVAQAGAPVPNPRLDQLLNQWEQKMKSVTAFEAEITRSETDPVAKTTEVYQGKVRFLRPDRATLYLVKSTNPQVYEHYVFTGTFLYEYRPQSKVMRIHEMPARAANQAQFQDNNLLNFLSGMKAEEAKQRFDLELAKEDQNYCYFFVAPKVAADRQEFAKARLVLWNSTYLPRQIELEDPAGAVVKWDIPKIDVNAKISAADFTPPEPPKDWKKERVARPTPQQAPAGVNPTQPQPQPSKYRPTGQ